MNHRAVLIGSLVLVGKVAQGAPLAPTLVTERGPDGMSLARQVVPETAAAASNGLARAARSTSTTTASP